MGLPKASGKAHNPTHGVPDCAGSTVTYFGYWAYITKAAIVIRGFEAGTTQADRQARVLLLRLVLRASRPRYGQPHP